MIKYEKIEVRFVFYYHPRKTPNTQKLIVEKKFLGPQLFKITNKNIQGSTEEVQKGMDEKYGNLIEQMKDEVESLNKQLESIDERMDAKLNGF
jgi:hypothetical protein